jgi:heme/copper-type cytochrome/quinol oxidase subunit 2
MLTGALASGALVGYEASKHQKHMAAAAASAHVAEGHMLLVTFIGLSLVVGVLTFIVATLVMAVRRPVRQRSYGGSR